MNALGTDVSHWQGNIEWSMMVDRKIQFAFMKATNGDLKKDDKYDANYSGAVTHSIRPGSYHYYTHFNSPVEQAEYFLSIAKPGPLAVDLEEQKGRKLGGLEDRIHQFIDTVSQKIGKPMIIYTSPSWWKLMNPRKLQWADAHYLWIANWKQNAPWVMMPWLPTRYTIWQCSVEPVGNVFGANSKALDLDVLNGPIEYFDTL